MTATTTTTTIAAPRVGWLPWRIALLFFFIFVVVWANDAVVNRYWISEAWESVLPGLGDSDLRKLTMRSHLTLGAIGLVFSPIQMITPFLRGWKTTRITASGVRQTNWYRVLHRTSGRIYIGCAILSYVFGQWFVLLKQFRLTGGYNMGVAFSLAGMALAYFAWMVWRTAPTRDSAGNVTPKNNLGYTVEDHRNYAIRSFSQIIAPIVYRYEYLLLLVLKLYRTPYLFNDDPRGEKLDCDEHNVCDDYRRPLDAFQCWFYWMGSWAVAEIVILCLPKKHGASPPPSSVPNAETTLLLDGVTATDDNNDNDNNGNGKDKDKDNKDKDKDSEHRYTQRSARVLNFLGWFLLVLTGVATVPIVISFFLFAYSV
mmetsp:Transcript_2296/g.5249  ORF Transcript_2296/g.5249 Transcript_2296/m.5249 type:complete len:370 (-) Transcript_2296:360-1469(-)